MYLGCTVYWNAFTFLELWRLRWKSWFEWGGQRTLWPEIITWKCCPHNFRYKHVWFLWQLDFMGAIPVEIWFGPRDVSSWRILIIGGTVWELYLPNQAIFYWTRNDMLWIWLLPLLSPTYAYWLKSYHTELLFSAVQLSAGVRWNTANGLQQANALIQGWCIPFASILRDCLPWKGEEFVLEASFDWHTKPKSYCFTWEFQNCLQLTSLLLPFPLVGADVG